MDIEQELRAEWWNRHGCPLDARYGDDGEMQCNRCGHDFRREPLDALRQYVHMRRLEAALAAAPPRTIADVKAEMKAAIAAGCAAEAPPPCPEFRPDHNGECLNCDEWADAHTPEAIAAGERKAR